MEIKIRFVSGLHTMLPEHIVRKILNDLVDARRDYLRNRLSYKLNYKNNGVHNYHIYETEADGSELFAAKLDIFEETPDCLRVRAEVNKFPYWKITTPWTTAFDFCVIDCGEMSREGGFKIRTSSGGEHAFFTGCMKQNIKWYWEFKSIIQMCMIVASEKIRNKKLWEWFVDDMVENSIWRRPMRKTHLCSEELSPVLFGAERRMRDMFLGVLRPQSIIDRIVAQ